MFAAEFLVVILAMIIGARWGGIFFGMAGGMGLAVLVYGFGLAPSNPPINVMLIRCLQRQRFKPQAVWTC